MDYECVYFEDDLFISKEVNLKRGTVGVGFGNCEYGEITKNESVQIIHHLIKVFKLSESELSNRNE